MSKPHKDYLQHSLDEINFVINNSTSINLTKDEFFCNEVLKRAIVRSLEIISQAIKKLPDELKSRYPQVNWQAITGTSDKLIYDYFEVNYSAVWDIAINEIPKLKKVIDNILKSDEMLSASLRSNIIKNSRIVLNVDGAARGNPGHAGIGIFIQSDDSVLLEEKDYIGLKTNNEAEYHALIIGLKKAINFGTNITVYSDSELMVKQLNGVYKVKQPHLKELCKLAKEQIAKFNTFNIKHCYRDSNKEADRLANEAIDEFNAGERSQVFLESQQEKLF